MANTDQASGNRIFISCVSGEFEHPTARYPGFRSLLRKALVRADCEVKVQEEFRQTEVDTVEKLDSYIRRCAAVLHFVGEMPGAIAHEAAVTAYLESEPNFLAKLPDLRAQLGDCSDLTFTQWEAFIALHHGVPLFVYANDKAVPNQEKHLKRLESVSRFASPFNGEADLFSQLIGDLRNIVPPLGKAAQRLGKQNFLHHTAELFLGREKELELLDTAWADGTNVLVLIAWGGVGKTALLSEWIQTRFIDKQWLAADGQPALLAYFDWSFYDQGTGSLAEGNVNRTGNVGDFFEQALAFFGDEDPTVPGKGARLAKLVRQQRTLLILDGLEPLQYPIGSPQAGRLLDPDLRDLLTSLAQANPGLCVVSSRQTLADLQGLHGVAAREQDLDDLPQAIAVRVLRQMQINGTDQELEEACDKFDCHALSITLLGRFLYDAHHGDIRRIDRVKDLHKADTLTREERQRTAWKVLEAYDAWLAQAKADGTPRTLAVLRLTGLFDRTASADCLSALRAEPVIPGLTEAIVGMDDDEWNVLLHRLERAHLIKLRADDSAAISLDAHPLVREYFAEQLKRRWPVAFRLAHSRLFDHLCEQTPYQPDDLPGLQPLYQAVVHGCMAGRHPEAREKVYRDRILRGTGPDGFYSTKKLGAIGTDLGAVASFFVVPWSRLSPNLTPADQAWLLNQAAVRLRAVGRLPEALEPMRLSGDMDKAERKWEGSAISASNLSELELTLGRLTDAVSDGRRSVEFADRSSDKDKFLPIGTRTTAADALHQAGKRAEAEELFIEAEKMRAECHPNFPLLYSVGGFRYADLLLTPAERAAWQTLGSLAGEEHGQDGRGTRECNETTRRAAFALEIAETKNWLLEIGLDKLSLSRAALYRALITGTVPDTLPQSVATALAKVHEANTLDQLPLALLTAAFYGGTLGQDPEQAKRYLDEAQLIADRGPMPLYLADVHLHRARLFRDKDELEKARKLITELGYGRRNEELADATAAAVDW